VSDLKAISGAQLAALSYSEKLAFFLVNIKKYVKNKGGGGGVEEIEGACGGVDFFYYLCLHLSSPYPPHPLSFACGRIVSIRCLHTRACSYHPLVVGLSGLVSSTR
jgi:hypothetical protein